MADLRLLIAREGHMGVLRRLETPLHARQVVRVLREELRQGAHLVRGLEPGLANASSRSCSLASQVRWGLGVMFAVIAREKLSRASYWLFASPIPARICGCVATTW